MSSTKPTEAALQLAAQCWCTPETENTVMDVALATEFARILDMQARLIKSIVEEKDKKISSLTKAVMGWARASRTKDETHNMQLAAISTATIQNTHGSVKERIPRENPYWTVAYGDVCTSVDREIKERERAEKLQGSLGNVALDMMLYIASSQDNEAVIQDLRNEVKRLRGEEDRLNKLIKSVQEWNVKIGAAVERMLAPSDPNRM